MIDIFKDPIIYVAYKFNVYWEMTFYNSRTSPSYLKKLAHKFTFIFTDSL